MSMYRPNGSRGYKHGKELPMCMLDFLTTVFGEHKFQTTGRFMKGLVCVDVAAACEENLYLYWYLLELFYCTLKI